MIFVLLYYYFVASLMFLFGQIKLADLNDEMGDTTQT